MVVQIVRYRSHLSRAEVQELFEARAPQYRRLTGLVQKYYVYLPDTDEYGGVYVWDSPESAQRFRDSELGRSISAAYRVEGAPAAQTAEVLLVLRPESTPIS